MVNLFNKCFCTLIKPNNKESGYLGYSDDIIDDSISIGSDDNWTQLNFGIQHDGKYILWASGEGRSEYYPKYCPECGRKLI